MNPIRLHIENFCAYDESDIIFSDFSSALIVGKINGNDKFSNGSGKSTIFSAIKYVLFNEVDFSTLDKAIRHGQDYCKITFDFLSAHDKETYRIVRSKVKKLGSEVRLFRKSQNIWEDITQRKNSDTEKEIFKILKINCKTFCNSVLFSQSDLSGLASLTPAHRKLALKEAFNINIYSKYEAIAKKKDLDLVKEIDREKIIIKTLGNPQEDLNKLNGDFLQKSDALSSKEILLKDKKSILNKEIEKYNIIYNKHKTYEERFIEIQNKQKKIKDEIILIEGAIKQYKHLVNILDDKRNNIIKDNNKIDTVIKQIQSENLKEKPLIDKELELLSKKIMNKKVLFNSILSKIEELKIPLPIGSKCNHCRQEINFHSKEDRDLFQEKINIDIVEKEKEKNNLKKDLIDLDNLIKSTNDILKKNDKNILEINKLIIDKNSNSKELETKNILNIEYLSLLKNNEINRSLKIKEQDVINNDILSFKPDKYKNIEKDLISYKNIINNLSFSIENINKEIEIISNNKAVLSHRIEERKKDNVKFKQCTDSLLGLESKHLVHQKVIQAFGSTGIPALITYTILDDFQLETNYWLLKLRPGLQLQFSVIKDRADGDQEETMDISYILDGHNLEYAQLSGAQKFIIALSLKLGLSSVIKKRLGVEIGMLLIDEVDKSIDEGGLEAFGDLLKHLQKDFKVLVITHNNELKEKFNHAILVEKDERLISTAKVVNRW